MSVARLHLLAVVAVAVSLSFAASSGAAGGLQSCGGGVRAAVVSCGKAKRIASEYLKTRTRSLQGYTCSSGRGQGRCTLDRKLILFPLG
jgi:hypothetical protein